MNDLEGLVAQLQNLAKYGSALGVLSWDEEVNLPSNAHAYRGEVNAMLSAELHNKFTSDELYNLVTKLADGDQANLSDDDRVIIKKTRRDIEQSRKIPTEFVEELSILTTQAFRAWVDAREKKDFNIFAPSLSKIIEMKKREAELMGYKHSPYDALLDDHEHGMNVEKIDAVFKPLADKLTKLIASVMKNKIPQLPEHNYPIEIQKELSSQVAAALGYDLSKGRIDISPHPFTTTFHPTDVRITTRYDETDFWVSLGSTIHEVGHALYEQGLPEKYYGTPLGDAVSLGMHESQSRGWENFVGRSEEFSHYLMPLLKKHFPGISYDHHQLYRWLNRISPSLIRVEADEVTYNLHIVIRYELEKALMQGELEVRDLPAAWNEKVDKYLGLKVPSDDLGVLQDVHWSHGSLGYFPTYTLGNIYAAQLFNTFKKSHPSPEDDFAKGNFGTYLAWLRKNIHSQGRRYDSNELIEKVTGEKVNSNYLIEHLEAKVRLNQS